MFITVKTKESVLKYLEFTNDLVLVSYQLIFDVIYIIKLQISFCCEKSQILDKNLNEVSRLMLCSDTLCPCMIFRII